MVMSLLLLRPMTFSQWVTATWLPSVNFSQAQISGSRRKEIRGLAQCTSSQAARAGTIYRETAVKTSA